MAGTPARYSLPAGTSGARRRALAQLELFFVDGSQQLVATGPDWRIAQSAVQCSEIYDGERYDERLEQTGWDTTDFDDSHWEHAGLPERPGRLVAQTSPPIRATQILSPLHRSTG